MFPSQKGSILIYTVVLIFIFSLVILGLLSYSTYELKLTRSSVIREQAFEIAEAGANYYEWHLAQFPSDYYDGNATSTSPGPYLHNYVDSDTGTTIGQFSLVVSPPATGSTITTVQSTGYTLANPSQKRTVTVRYGIPSLAKYAFLTNSDIWIGSGEIVNGPVHSNGGIRFDGTGNSLITSAKQTYTCQSWSGSPCPATESGVWGSAPQSTQNYWQYPVSNVDFSAITSNLSTLKSSAQTSGLYLPPSNSNGYSLVFKNNGTIDVYKVTALNNDPTGWDVNGTAHTNNIDYQNRVFLYNKPWPSNGIIFVEDQTWVEGTVTGRVTVVTAKLPYNVNTAPSIIVQNNLVYAAKDGTDSLGLIAQQDFLIGYLAPTNLEIDGAIIAQNGSVQIWDWPGITKNTLTLFGSVASYGLWTWNYVNTGGTLVSGFANTATNYDTNLLYSPPPSFPLSSSGYQQISWTSN